MRTDQLLDRADDLLHRGRADQAATLLTPVVGEEPGNGEAWLLLARALLALRKPEPALDAARQALRLTPGGLEPLYWVSVAYSTLGRHDLAVASAVTAGREDPGNPRLAERHGRALLAAGRTGEALDVLAAGAEFAHYDADLHVAHGVALFAAGRPLSAREAHGRALAVDPSHAQAQAELRRLTAAERRIVDAASLIRVTDAFAESLRIPPGGLRSARPANGVLAHMSAVAFAVCSVAAMVLAVVGQTTEVVVPAALPLSLLCAAGSAACVTVLARRPGSPRRRG